MKKKKKKKIGKRTKKKTLKKKRNKISSRQSKAMDFQKVIGLNLAHSAKFFKKSKRNVKRKKHYKRS